MPRKNTNPRYRKLYKGVKIDLTAPTEAELEEKVRARKNVIDEGLVVGSEAGTSVAAWSEIWLKTYKKGKVSTNNYKQYEANLRLHILPRIGGMKLSDVRQYDLQSVLNEKEKYSTTHQIHIKNAITGMFKSAYDNGLIRVNPALGLRISKRAEIYRDEDDEKAGHRALTDKEAEQFLRRAGEHYAGTAFKIIYYCGLRPDEVCALGPESFDFKAGKETVSVRWAVENTTRAVKRPKTKAGIRTVPIPAVFVPELKELVGKAKKEEKKYIFSTADGRPMDTDDLSRWWKFLRNYIDRAEGATLHRNKIVEHAFAPDLTPYDLRHTCATNFQRSGISLNVARVLLGHEKVETTAKFYVHHTEDMTDDARKKMSNFAETKGTPTGTFSQKSADADD